MSGSLLPNGVQTFTGPNGTPLSGGSVYFYVPGTTTAKNTYQDAAQTILNPNPVVLNANGQAIIYGTGDYRQIAYDEFDNLVWDELTSAVISSAALSATGTQAGASLIGTADGNTLAQLLNLGLNRVVDSVSALRALSHAFYTRAFATGFYAPHDGGGGAYQYDPSDTTSADNGVTIIVASDGGRWKLQYSGAVAAQQAGAKLDGTTDNSSVVQAAINALAGGTLRFRYTGTGVCLLNSTLTQSTPPCNFIIDPGVTFTGTGGLPAAVTNSHQLNVGTYMSMTPVGGSVDYGATTFQVESLPGANFIGNAVPIYGGVASPAGSPNFTGFLWGANFLANMNASTGTYNAIGVEIDLNNNYQAGYGDGLLVTGLGTFSPNYGVAVRRANTTSDWLTGVYVENFVTGMMIDGTNAAAPAYGLRIQQLDVPHLRMTPATDNTPTSVIAYLTNAAGSTINWKLSKRGGMQIGAGGTEISLVTSGTYSTASQSVPAASTVDLSISVPSAVYGQQVIGVPTTLLPAGLTWCVVSTGNGTVDIRVANVTGSAITLPAITWRIDVVIH